MTEKDFIMSEAFAKRGYEIAETVEKLICPNHAVDATETGYACAGCEYDHLEGHEDSCGFIDALVEYSAVIQKLLPTSYDHE